MLHDVIQDFPVLWEISTVVRSRMLGAPDLVGCRCNYYWGPWVMTQALSVFLQALYFVLSS